MKLFYKNRNISLLFVLFFGLAVYGFFRSYFSLFPAFSERITLLTHIHGISITFWMLILIIQPLLIRFGKHSLHRLIGRYSYAYVAVISLIMILTIRQGYLKGVGRMSQADLLAFQFVPVSAFLCFILSYVLAIVIRSRRDVHKSYMIVHALGLLWAAFGRLDYHWLGVQTFEQSIAVSYLPSAFLLILIFMYEWVVQKKMNRVYLIASGAFLATPFLYYFAAEGFLWQRIAKIIFHT
ncbi:hypothetical protein GVN16_05370 [Emticicia sp. CRIBPO]|uniref:hypothetical protein n=1 Tax=Emticicia sp. CRIBPO TaxID=2683258 RepID=UPI0014132EB2|nr:hypothetical protein [Emticicia sp. CRIBPO]NBA85178.1 hypothetical protein [Emticicia sp. CRIBPO]